VTLREIQQTAEKLGWDLPMMATGYFTVRIDCKAKRRMEWVRWRTEEETDQRHEIARGKNV